MKRHLAALLVVQLVLLAVLPLSAQATHKSTLCKWNFPWPRTVYYYIQTGAGQFTSAEADRVMYGNSSWTEAGYNLLFSRVSNPDWATNYTEHFKGAASDTTIAWARVSPSTNCNRDLGNPITRVEIIWNNTKHFNLDCLAAGQQNCVNNGEYDLHNVSIHEVGHWFFIADEDAQADSEHTMYTFIDFGEVKKRSLEQHDKDTAWIMYGCRSGYVCH